VQLCTVVRLVEESPIPAIHGVVRWRFVDLAGWIYDAYSVSLHPSSLGKFLKKLGYAGLSARPCNMRARLWTCLSKHRLVARDVSRNVFIDRRGSPACDETLGTNQRVKSCSNASLL